MHHIEITRYLSETKFIKRYEILSFAKNMSKNIDKNIRKNLSSKYSQKLLGHVKKYTIDALKTISKRPMKNRRSN